MATTTAVKLYDPEVWEDLAQAEFRGKIVIANAAAQEDTLVGKPGDTVSFPKWDTLGEMDDLDEGVAMATEVMGQSSTKAKIKEAGKAVEITDSAMLIGMGDPQAEAIRQFGVLAARKVDTDLAKVAVETVTGGRTRPDGTVVGDSAPFKLASTVDHLDWDTIVDAQAMFGDDFDLADVYGLIIRSDQQAAIHKDKQFISAVQGATGNDLVRRGFLGQIGGMDVFVTDRLMPKTSLILKRGALGLLYKRRPVVEQDRDILARTNIATTNLHYAVKRMNDRGVCVLTTA